MLPIFIPLLVSSKHFFAIIVGFLFVLFVCFMFGKIENEADKNGKEEGKKGKGKREKRRKREKKKGKRRGKSKRVKKR